MSLIAPDLSGIVDGATADATDVTNPFNTIINDYNGNITTANFAAAGTDVQTIASNTDWTSWTPGLTNITGTATGKYWKVGAYVAFEGVVTVTGSASGNIGISLPTTPAAPFTTIYFPLGSATDFDSGTGIAFGVMTCDGSNKIQIFNLAGTPGALAQWNATYPHTWKNGDFIYFSGFYKSA